MDFYETMEILSFQLSYLAVLNGPERAEGGAVLQSYTRGTRTISCIAHIWGKRERQEDIF